MIKKSVTKLIGLKKQDFDLFVESGQIKVQPARLIPHHKTGSEGALTSIFLSCLKLIKEYRYNFFKELKVTRSGKVYYYTEACFPDIEKDCRVDGLIIVVVKGIVTDAVFFEMKNKKNYIDKEQIEKYIVLSKKLRINKLVTISNEFVADSSHSPIRIKTSKNFFLLHFSWTYLITKARLLLFKNDANIKDEDQVEIMREALYYFENKDSGINGYTQMKRGWKELAENIKAEKPLKLSDSYIEDAILSWHEEEKDMALLLSRKLGVLVKSEPKNKESLKNDIKRIVKENYILGKLSIKNSVSDIKIKVEFERRIVAMNVKILPPLNKGTIARISWINKQLENCKKKSPEIFDKMQDKIWVEADVKFAKENQKVRLVNLSSLSDLTKGKEIKAFNIVLVIEFKANFASTTKFISLIEQMVLDYYEGIVQHMTNWNKPAPKLEN